jgi:hypothetical protein
MTTLTVNANNFHVPTCVCRKGWKEQKKNYKFNRQQQWTWQCNLCVSFVYNIIWELSQWYFSKVVKLSLIARCAIKMQMHVCDVTSNGVEEGRRTNKNKFKTHAIIICHLLLPHLQ